MAKQVDNVVSAKVVTLLVNPKQRFINFAATFLAVALITSAIAWNSLQSHRAAPINIELLACALGGLLFLLPLSEAWAYRPWQDAPRKIEHEICD
jgi:hypothetical protein